eukprot:TRINITY_DN16696_c0_g1_i1.p1 TRINITY_DN16696_c0_g1~~TRINITY_DN16696_c0_g1_i1.p1  ORF type:complete len:804 (-),score=201.72 TRINITY_DN16696_c0_g1_i1:781-3117(-)
MIDYYLNTHKVLGCSVAFVDGQDLVWSEGFGHSDLKKTTPATSKTLYRAGSITKLITDIAVMQLVEEGLLDIDKPIEDYMTDFHPPNPFSTKITTRHLMTHTSGLVREPPVGSYFDNSNPSLEATIESVNSSPLLTEPGTVTKYSNVGIAVLGHLVSKLSKKDWRQRYQETLLSRMGMKSSTLEEENFKGESEMWRYDRYRFQAPQWTLGCGPAGCLISTVEDLSEFARTLMNNGTNVRTGQSILKHETLKTMFEPQGNTLPNTTHETVVEDVDVTDMWTTGDLKFGLGFVFRIFKDFNIIFHGGAIYGYSSIMWFCPELNIGMAFCASIDFGRALGTRVGSYVLNYVRAQRNTSLSVPKFSQFYEIPHEICLSLEGTYKNEKGDNIELKYYKGPSTGVNSRAPSRLLWNDRLFTKELKLRYPNGNVLVVDDLIHWGGSIKFNDTFDQLIIGNDIIFTKQPAQIPQDVSEKYKAIIGEYGWDHSLNYITERYGKLWLLLEFFFYQELIETSEDTFTFPPSDTFYMNEKVVMKWNEKRTFITGFEVSGIFFPKRYQDLDENSFLIKLTKPVIPTLQAAKLLEPPKAQTWPPHREPELLDVSSLDPTIKVDLLYASKRNVFGEVFYEVAKKAFLQKPAAEALVRAHQKLSKLGYGIIAYDLYRPWHVSKAFWDVTPEPERIFVANPENGSLHNRGCAADISLYDLSTGEVVDMGSGFDECTPRSFADYQGLTSKQRYFRRLLRKAMEEEGFAVFIWEWWHFDYKDAPHYPVTNIPLDKID